MLHRPIPLRLAVPFLLAALLLPLAAGPARAAANLPDTLVLSPEVLYASRQKGLARDGSVRAAMEALKTTADAAMRAPVEPIPARPGPGGAAMAHAYRSLDPDWWPDPKSKSGLPYLRRDGERNPEADGDAYDFGRLSRMSRTVRSLALAWYMTGNELYAARAAAHLRAWFCDPATRMATDLSRARLRPGTAQGDPAGIIETACLIDACEAARLIEPSRSWGSADDRRMREWFANYLDWLLHSDFARREGARLDRHGTWFDAQVAVYALFAGDERLARETAGLTGNRRMATQIMPDGTMPREADGGRRAVFSNLRAFFILASVGERLGLNVWDWATATGQSIRKALDRAAPDLTPGEGDADFDPYPYVPLFRRAALVYKDTRYLDYLDALDAKTLARQPSCIAY